MDLIISLSRFMPKRPILDIPGGLIAGMQMCLVRPIMKSQPGQLSGIFTILGIACGDLPGTGVITPRIGMHGHPTTGTTTMDTILTGIITIIHITVTGIITGPGHIIPSIITVYVYTVLQWL